MSKLAQSMPADLMFRALSDPTRLRILHLLLAGELCVCDLVAVIAVPQPTASRHLAYLRRTHLVVPRREGAWIYYALTPAKTAFHKKLLECLALSSGQVREISGDKVRIRALQKSTTRCC